MDCDNPSYFSVPDDHAPTFTTFNKPGPSWRTDSASSSLENKPGPSWRTDSVSSSSDCSLNRHHTPPKNRPMRSLLRSVSTNSADSNNELFIQGQPRLSDMAPDLLQKHTSSRSSTSSVKSTSKYDPHSDLMYLPLATSEETSEHSGDEVFLGEDSARYYNCSAVKQNGQRRHSLSAFMARERANSVASSTKSFKEDFPQGMQSAENDTCGIDDHSLRHASYPRKGCTRCFKGTPIKPTNMDDILMVYLKANEVSCLWVNYFANHFEQRSKQANKKDFKIRHLTLEEIVESEDPKIIVEQTAGVKLQLVVLCPSFLDFISQNQEKCQTLGNILLADRTLALLLGVSDNDLVEAHKKVLPTYFQWQRQAVGQDQDEHFTKTFLNQAMAILSKVWKQQSTFIAQEKACFSIQPRKISQGKNSAFIMLTYALQKEDIIKVSVEKNDQMFVIQSPKRKNPYTIKIAIPEELTEVTAIVNVLVEVNGNIIGSRPIKCESKLKAVEQNLRDIVNPIEFMCQALGFSPSDTEHLDNWMLQAFERNKPQHFSLLANRHTPFSSSVQVHKHSNEEYPTLLHLAARFGLEKLIMQLLECPGAEVAYEIRNSLNMTPTEIADHYGHNGLSTIIENVMDLHKFSNMYTELKISEAAKGSFHNLYSPCPPPRPVDFPSFPSTSRASPTFEVSPIEYMPMHTPVHLVSQKEEEVPSTSSKKSHPIEPKVKIVNQTNNDPFRDSYTDKRTELSDILNSYKVNRDLDLVAKMVDVWANREDVQESYQEIKKMQEKIRGQSASDSFWQQMRSWFHKKKESPESSQDISVPLRPLLPNSPARPTSSMSSTSSASSGRLSTLSGCSVGDSGTHSDTDDRKTFQMICPEEDYSRGSSHLNYSQPPAPKPVKTFPAFETIEERPTINSQNEETPHYIQMPPNGRPVQGPSETREYMNIPPQIDHREYMNFKPPSSNKT